MFQAGKRIYWSPETGTCVLGGSSRRQWRHHRR
ncbi:hypothetical protein [Kribbella sp. VKM Ac-2568]